MCINLCSETHPPAPKPNLKIEGRTLFHWSSLEAEDRSPVKVEI